MHLRGKTQLSPISRFRSVVLLALASLLGCFAMVMLIDRAPAQRLPWLRIEEVEIQAEWPLSVETIRQYLPKLEGASLLAVQPRELIGRLDGKPWIRSVTLKKEYPNRLFIDVTAKRAVAVSVVRGEPTFLDADGAVIDRASPAILRTLDLPVVTLGTASEHGAAPIVAIRVLERLRRELEPEYRISEVVFSPAATFRVFISPIRTEAIFSLETYDAQLPRLRLLLDSPSFPKWQPHRINLVFPKKAIVSTILSK